MRDPVEVEEPQFVGGLVQAVDLVLEHGVGEIAVDRAFVLGTTARCAAAVDDDDGEPLVGEPLRAEIRVVRLHDALGVRATVRIHEHRERRAVVIVRQHHGGGRGAPSRREDPHVRGHERVLGERCESSRPTARDT